MKTLSLEKLDGQNIYTVQSDVKNSDLEVQEFIDYLGVVNKHGTPKLVITIEGAKQVVFTQFIEDQLDEGIYKRERQTA